MSGMVVIRIKRVFQICPESEIYTHTAGGRRRSGMPADVAMIPWPQMPGQRCGSFCPGCE